eukprot:PITA_02107
MEQQRQYEEELTEPPTISDRASKEVRQTLIDVKEFIGTPKRNKRQRRQPDRYPALVVQEVVPTPEDKSVVGSRWIYKIKYAADDSVEKYKAMFVAKGYAQKDRIYYEETFAPVAKYTFIRSFISLAIQMGWHIHQMDVKTTFLNEVIEEEVYIE